MLLSGNSFYREPRNEIFIVKIAFPRIDEASPESKPDTYFSFSCPLDRQLVVLITRLSLVFVLICLLCARVLVIQQSSRGSSACLLSVRT